MKKYLYVLGAIIAGGTTFLFNMVLLQSILKTTALTLTVFASQLMIVGITFCILYTLAHTFISAINLFFKV